MNLNKALILGRLTNDPDSRVLPSGQPVTNFSMATNRMWTDKSGNKQEDAQFHNIVVFGKLADIASRYLAKGRLALIEGRIQTRSWEDASGNRRYRTEIIAENLQLGPRSASDTSGDKDNSKPASKPDSSGDNSKNDEIPVIEQDEVDTSDIPF
jgi:single-strand DNA-binding protein